MEPRTNTDGDRRLTLVVAGSVVAAVVAILLVAGLTGRDENEDVSAALESEVEPQSTPYGTEPTLESTELTETELALVPAADAIDPNAEPWQAGLAAWSERDYARSAAYFAADAEKRPEHAPTHYMLGLALWKSGQLDGAVEALARAASLDESSIRTFVNLARVRLARGEADAALLAADRALEIDPEAVPALYQKARALYASERADEAVALLEEALELDPAAGEAHNLLGLIRLRRGEWVSALPSLEIGAALLPRAAYAQNNYGLALERAGRYEEAAVAFRRATEADPQHEAARLSFARVAPSGIDESSPPVEVARGANGPPDVSDEPQLAEHRGVPSQEPSSD